MSSPSRNGIYVPDLISPQRTIGARSFDFSRQVAIMAVINRTPDLSHDQGRTYALDKATEAVRQQSRPAPTGSISAVCPSAPAVRRYRRPEELERVIPVVEAARAASNVVISVSTYRTEVARRAVAAGANVIDDTSGLHDPELADLVARTGATLVITHSLASTSRTPVLRPAYDDVAEEVVAFLG